MSTASNHNTILTNSTTTEYDANTMVEEYTTVVTVATAENRLDTMIAEYTEYTTEVTMATEEGKFDAMITDTTIDTISIIDDATVVSAKVLIAGAM